MGSSLFFTVIGFTSSFVACLLNTGVSFVMWSDRSYKAQRFIIFGINISRAILSLTICAFWVTWSAFHGRAIERAVFAVQRHTYWVYACNTLLFTIDRLMEALLPLRYKTLPIGIMHRIAIAFSSIIGISSIILCSLLFKGSGKYQAYLNLPLDVICLLVHPIAYYYINKKWSSKMKLARNFGAFQKSLERLDVKTLKIGTVVAICSVLTSVADISMVFMQIRLSASKTRMPVAILTLFSTILYVLQPIFCVLMSLSSGQRKHGWLDRRRSSSWKFL